MKPDLTYYHKSPLHLKNFLYFPEKKNKKNTSKLPNHKPKKQKRFLYFGTDADKG